MAKGLVFQVGGFFLELLGFRARCFGKLLACFGFLAHSWQGGSLCSHGLSIQDLDRKP